jgi:hypothetical protein
MVEASSSLSAFDGIKLPPRRARVGDKPNCPVLHPADVCGNTAPYISSAQVANWLSPFGQWGEHARIRPERRRVIPRQALRYTPGIPHGYYLKRARCVRQHVCQREVFREIHVICARTEHNDYRKRRRIGQYVRRWRRWSLSGLTVSGTFPFPVGVSEQYAFALRSSTRSP